MAWNRSDNTKTTIKKNKRNGNVFVRGGFAAAIVIAGSVVAWFLLSESNMREGKSTNKPTSSRIKDVQPSIPAQSMSNGAAKAAATTKPRPRNEATTKTYIDANGFERYPGGARVPRKNPKFVELPDRRVVKWEFDSEDTIATLVEMEPGDTVIGDEVYGAKFVEDFKRSLKKDIVITDEDGEYARQVKADVIAAKKDLVEAMNRGEDIAKIMTDARREMRQLYEYRESLLAEVHKIRNDNKDLTEQDLKDLTSAANEMLKEKGIAPIKLPRLTVRKIKRSAK